MDLFEKNIGIVTRSIGRVKTRPISLTQPPPLFVVNESI